MILSVIFHCVFLFIYTQYIIVYRHLVSRRNRKLSNWWYIFHRQSKKSDIVTVYNVRTFSTVIIDQFENLEKYMLCTPYTYLNLFEKRFLLFVNSSQMGCEKGKRVQMRCGRIIWTAIACYLTNYRKMRWSKQHKL